MYSFLHGFLLLFARLMAIVGIEHFCYLKKLPGTLLSVEPLLPQLQARTHLLSLAFCRISCDCSQRDGSLSGFFHLSCSEIHRHYCYMYPSRSFSCWVSFHHTNTWYPIIFNWLDLPHLIIFHYRGSPHFIILLCRDIPHFIIFHCMYKLHLTELHCTNTLCFLCSVVWINHIFVAFHLWVYHNLSVYHLMDFWVVSHLWQIPIMLIWSLTYKPLCRNVITWLDS